MRVNLHRVSVVLLAGLLAWDAGAPAISRGAGAASPAAPPGSVQIDSILLKISKASLRVSYSGTQEYVGRHNGKPMQLRWRVFHWSPQRTYIQFLFPDTLRGAAFLKDGDLFRFNGDRHVGRALGRGGFSRLLQNGHVLEEIELLRKNYDIRLHEGSLYLGRPVYTLRVEPKYRGRPSFFARVDVETGILLYASRQPGAAAAAVDTGASISRFMDIRFGPPRAGVLDDKAWQTESRDRRKADEQKFDNVAALLNTGVSELLLPEKIPAGFVLRKLRKIDIPNRSMVHLLYTDGLSAISLFERKGKHAGRRRRDHHGRGGKRPFALIHGNRAGLHYSIVGEIGRKELESMAASLVPVTRKQDSRQPLLLAAAVGIIVVLAFFLLKRSREKT